MRHVILFDVNETMLDLAALDPHFEALFGDAAARREWFQQLLQSALVATVTDAYADFGAIGRAALSMVVARRGIEAGAQPQQELLLRMRELPPHPEVPQALDRLRSAGFRLAALTNSTLEVAEAQLVHAGIADRFEQILSADTPRRIKPAAGAYRAAARAMGVPEAETRLVAAHAWDVAGAMRAGCAAAFVARPGMVLDPLAPVPDITGADLLEVADAIIAREG
ncbi:haloacid dehalogenase type II [Marinimicrococcus flavescens]|uniref:(S)-2-haloacid dehalogenase n=1 Tax=Marinimicrococcus flavescens TaxID=3031815 RepID=A0AAP4D6B0_9PROT|nr:haloacid dehalogenase type II [Marinimicrococcus flavescens]